MGKQCIPMKRLVAPMILLLLVVASCQKQPVKTEEKTDGQTSAVKTGVAAAEGADVFVDGNKLRFNSLASYEKYASNESDRTILKNFADGSEGFKSLQERKFGIQDELYDLFLDQILNEDHIVSIGSFLVKLDLENDRGLATDRNAPNAY